MALSEVPRIFELPTQRPGYCPCGAAIDSSGPNGATCSRGHTASRIHEQLLWEQRAAPLRLVPSLPHSYDIQEWQPPAPFHRIRLPAFPVDVFPEWLRLNAVALGEALQVPVDLIALLSLAVLATVCAN